MHVLAFAHQIHVTFDVDAFLHALLELCFAQICWKDFSRPTMVEDIEVCDRILIFVLSVNTLL